MSAAKLKIQFLVAQIYGHQTTKTLKNSFSQYPSTALWRSNHLWLRFVTARSGHNSSGLRKTQKSGFN
jgi:hypothetical protein